MIIIAWTVIAAMVVVAIILIYMKKRAGGGTASVPASTTSPTPATTGPTGAKWQWKVPTTAPVWARELLSLVGKTLLWFCVAVGAVGAMMYVYILAADRLEGLPFSSNFGVPYVRLPELDRFGEFFDYPTVFALLALLIVILWMASGWKKWVAVVVLIAMVLANANIMPAFVPTPRDVATLARVPLPACDGKERTYHLKVGQTANLRGGCGQIEWGIMPGSCVRIWDDQNPPQVLVPRACGDEKIDLRGNARVATHFQALPRTPGDEGFPVIYILR